MLYNTLAVSSFLVATAFTAAEPRPYKLEVVERGLGSMSLNSAFGLAKRQSGYAPTSTECDGPGTTCPEVCGTTTQQCASSDGELHCFDPTIKQICCPDGSGLACSDGYFCTQDNAGGTWCCPDGMSLDACAAIYSVTGLSSLAPATSAPTSAPSASAAAATTPVKSTPTFLPSVGTGAPTSTFGTNATVTTGSTAPFQFTGGANTAGYGGLPVLAIGVAAAFAAI